MCLGIIALLTGKTGDIITLSCFGALVLYILAMISVLALRRKEPGAGTSFPCAFLPALPDHRAGDRHRIAGGDDHAQY